MRKLFFLSVPNSGISKMAEQDVIAAAATKLQAAGAKDYDVFYGEAVHWDNPDRVEQGAVVHISDDDLAFRSALQLKDWLRHGTYLVVLNETSVPNVTFRCAAATKDATISKTAEIWKDCAGQLLEEEHLFVAAFVFRDTDGEIAVIGNANPDMVFDMNKWQETAKNIVARFNKNLNIILYEPIFMERVDDFDSGAEDVHEEMMNVSFKLLNCDSPAERQDIASKTIASLDKRMQLLKDKFPHQARLWELLNREWQSLRYNLSLYINVPL